MYINDLPDFVTILGDYSQMTVYWTRQSVHSSQDAIDLQQDLFTMQ